MKLLSKLILYFGTIFGGVSFLGYGHVTVTGLIVYTLCILAIVHDFLFNDSIVEMEIVRDEEESNE